MNRVLAFSFILAALALQATSGHGEILLDNTNNLTGIGTSTQYVSNGASTSNPDGGSPFQFTYGYNYPSNANSYDITSVSLALVSGSSVTGTPTIRLKFWQLADGATQPALNAAPFFQQDFTITASTTPQYFTFPITSTVNFSALTGYSIGFSTDQVSGSNSGRVGWRTTAPLAAPTGPVGTVARRFYSTNSDVSFGSVTNGLDYGFQLTGTEVTAVPEPSTWALAVAGVTYSAWGMARRRRRAAGDACEA